MQRNFVTTVKLSKQGVRLHNKFQKLKVVFIYGKL
jgi:hypothetical protein